MQLTLMDKNRHSLKWLFLSLLLIVLFFSLGLAVKYTSLFDDLNQATIIFLIHHHTHLADIFFTSVTLLCEPPYYYVLAAALLIWLSIYHHGLLAIHFFMTISIIYYISPYLKNLFKIVRPSEGIANIGYAFPSGHTLLACVAFGFLSLILTQHLTGKTKYKMMLIYNIPVILVGLSRLYLGVHWVTDVLGGLLIGWAINNLSFSICPQQSGIKPNKWFFIIMGVALLVVAYLINLQLDAHLHFYDRITNSLQ